MSLTIQVHEAASVSNYRVLWVVERSYAWQPLRRASRYELGHEGSKQQHYSVTLVNSTIFVNADHYHKTYIIFRPIHPNPCRKSNSMSYLITTSDQATTSNITSFPPKFTPQIRSIPPISIPNQRPSHPMPHLPRHKTQPLHVLQ